jgi:exportin-5
MREGTLKKACVEIFTPSAVLSDAFPNRQIGPNVRCGTEGWLARLSVVIDQCLVSDLTSNLSARTCAAKAFNVFFSLMTWIIPKAVAASGCVSILERGLSASDLSVQKVRPY